MELFSQAKQNQMPPPSREARPWLWTAAWRLGGQTTEWEGEGRPGTATWGPGELGAWKERYFCAAWPDSEPEEGRAYISLVCGFPARAEARFLVGPQSMSPKILTG